VCFVRFSARGVQKHHKTKFGRSLCQKLLQKNPGGGAFLLQIFPSVFFIAFLAVSLRGVFKNTTNIFSENSPENLKNLSRKKGKQVRRFFMFFSSAPLGTEGPPKTPCLLFFGGIFF
jgi:hypothetical protein